MKLVQKIINPFHETTKKLDLESKWRHRLLKMIYILWFTIIAVIAFIIGNQEDSSIINTNIEIDYQKYKLTTNPLAQQVRDNLIAGNVSPQSLGWEEKSMVLDDAKLSSILSQFETPYEKKEAMKWLMNRWYIIPWVNDIESKITQAPVPVAPQISYGENKYREPSTLWKTINQISIIWLHIFNNLIILIWLTIVHLLLMLIYFKGILYIIYWDKKI